MRIQILAKLTFALTLAPLVARHGSAQSADTGTHPGSPQAAASRTEVTRGPIFRSNAREVSVVFRVLDKNKQPVSGITRNDIRVEDEGISRDITSFAGDVAHAQVVVVADVSGSMSTVVEPLQGALYGFADLVAKDFDREPGDVLLSLVPFSDTASVLVDRTPNPAEFKEAVRRLRPSGSTALVDTMLATLLNAFPDKESSREVGRSAVVDTGPIPSEFRRKRPTTTSGVAKRSKFLVIFTDAGENASAHQWSDIASAMLGKEVVIYSVVFDSGTPDSNVRMVSNITEESGGKVYRATADALGRVYGQIAKDIRNHYALTFSASDVDNPRLWRRIRLSTSRPSLTIFARSGYCPEAPCQKADGTFVGGHPKNWREVLEISRDPGVSLSVKQHLQQLQFQYSPETERIVKDLANNPVLIEKTWVSHGNHSGRAEKPSFIAHKIANGNQLLSIEAEVCGIKVDPEPGASPQHNTASDPFLQLSKEPSLRVVDPEIRIARRPGSAQPNSSGASEDSYFQSQALFYLKDPSGRIASRIRVQCNRPHFLVSEGLVDLASKALEQGLKVSPQDTRSP